MNRLRYRGEKEKDASYIQEKSVPAISPASGQLVSALCTGIHATTLSLTCNCHCQVRRSISAQSSKCIKFLMPFNFWSHVSIILLLFSRLFYFTDGRKTKDL